MSITFEGLNYNDIRSTPFGDIPTTVSIQDTFEAEIDDPRYLNMANSTACTLLRFLGIADHVEVAATDMRRAIVKARATFDSKVSRYTCPEEITYDGPRETEDGTTNLKPPRCIHSAIDAEYIREKIDILEQLTIGLQERGATHITWI